MSNDELSMVFGNINEIKKANEVMETNHFDDLRREVDNGSPNQGFVVDDGVSDGQDFPTDC